MFCSTGFHQGGIESSFCKVSCGEVCVMPVLAIVNETTTVLLESLWLRWTAIESL